MMSSLQMCCWLCHIDCLWQCCCERVGNRGTCCIYMEELRRPLKRFNLCYVIVDAEILCISAEGFPCLTGLEGFPVLHCCVLGLESWALQQAECSQRSQALQLQCPHRLYDSAQCCWRCLSKVVSDCIRAGTDAEPRALRSHGADF